MATRKKASKRKTKKKSRAGSRKKTKRAGRGRAKRKVTRRKRAASAGQGATGLVASLNRAFEDASRQAVKDTLKALPGSTRVGKLLDQLSSSPYLDLFHNLSLHELGDALRNVPHELAEVPRRSVARARSEGSARKRPGRKSSKSHNTRTEAGRNQLDEAVAAHVKASGTASAEAIRADVGGTPPQIRGALGRLIEARKVKRSGQRRRTRYTWKG